MTKIYHNPKCGTSRNTLAILQKAGEEIEVIEYLKTPPTREGLVKMIVDAGETPRSAMRAKQQEAEDLSLRDAAATDEAILDGMMQHPILTNRPSVITPKPPARITRSAPRGWAKAPTWAVFRPSPTRCMTPSVPLVFAKATCPTITGGSGRSRAIWACTDKGRTGGRFGGPPITS